MILSPNGGRRGYAVIALVFAVFMLGAIAAWSFADDNSSSQGATGVLHVTAVKVVGDGEGRTGSENLVEAWLDDTNRRYRVTIRDANGTTISDLLVDGRLKVDYTPEGNYGNRRTYDDPDAYDLRLARHIIWLYKELLDLEVAKQTGTGQQGGVSTITVSVPPNTGGNQDVEAVLDAVTFAPLIETVYLTSETGRIISHVIKTTYNTWEIVPDEELPAGVFQLEMPDAARVKYYNYLTEASAAAITDRKIYYVGSEFNGIPIYSMHIIQKDMERYGVPDIDRVYVQYGQEGTFWQRPPAGERPYVISEPLPTEEELVKIKREVQSGVIRVESTGKAKVNIVKGDTLVTISGANEAEVRDAMEMLRQINPQ